jgi:hypothetical protein
MWPERPHHAAGFSSLRATSLDAELIPAVVRQAGPDVSFQGEGAVDRALVRYLQQSKMLCLTEPADEFQVAVDVVEQTIGGLALLAIGSVNPECRSRTVTASSRHCLRRAYIATVIDTHDPSAARSRSYGVGPVSVPPAEAGSSPVSQCRPTAISCANPAALPWTVTVPAPITSDGFLVSSPEALTQNSFQDLAGATLG